jgi:hypothetical protein
MPGASDFVALIKRVKDYKAVHGIEYQFTYFRGGSYEHHERPSRRERTAYLYKVPPTPQGNERIGKQGIADYCRVLEKANVFITCVHTIHLPCRSISMCLSCIYDASRRLEATLHGRVALSLYESVESRGRMVIWRDTAGEFHSETFKRYLRADVEIVLAALVAWQPALAHPLFVAQDPDLFWPIISYHGTVRAALEYVAPHVNWNARLGKINLLHGKSLLLSILNRVVFFVDVAMSSVLNLISKTEKGAYFATAMDAKIDLIAVSYV